MDAVEEKNNKEKKAQLDITKVSAMLSRPNMAGLRPLLQILIFISILLKIDCQVLAPSYFNLALGKKITASATCGEFEPEQYCKLVGVNPENEDGYNVIHGQFCDICDSRNPEKAHPPEHAIDDLDTWWQSPPLSRDLKYNEVNLTIALGQPFHVAYLYIRMGNSPRPGLWILEKSTDYGKTFKPWQYFSDSEEECARLFGRESLQPISRDDSVICTTEYSQIVPLEGGEIPISLLKYRPSANKYFNSSVLQEWTRATDVRLRFLRTKNMLGHLMSVIPDDPSVTRRFYYSVKDINIGGRCMCNGHADTCDPDVEGSLKLKCRCQHNTCGEQCAQCCSGFQQKKWKIFQDSDRFQCESCNCHNHATECKYDAEVDAKHLSLDINGNYEGGGVCQNCQHNTEGINCNKCKDKFYRPSSKVWNDTDVCQPCNCNYHNSTGNCDEGSGQCECRPEFNPPNCDSCRLGYFDYPNCKPCPCNLNGTEELQCEPIEGRCFCKFNYGGEFCQECADGYYSPECKECECNDIGSVSTVCNKETGKCECKSKYGGRNCEQCEAGYYNYPTCEYCNCDPSGTEEIICDVNSGKCICKEGFGGTRCDQCIPGYYMDTKGHERKCVPCNCSTLGSASDTCSMEGKCLCINNFGGKQCDQCAAGFYSYPRCEACNCDTYGSIGESCDDKGQCQCKPNFDKPKCDQCKELFYNYPACEECNCDPKGVTKSFAGCGSVPAGELCECKERVQGRICNDCKPLFWNLQDYNPHGCEDCNCDTIGTQGGIGVCNTKTGQCPCKLAVGSKSCGECRDGYYNLVANNLFGCTDCDCDVGGADGNICDKSTGQCKCHPRIEGRKCDEPIKAHYFPTLHQFQYELEDGRTLTGDLVRVDIKEHIFPGYSWKSYAVFSHRQTQVFYDVLIQKSSIFRMVIRYVNPTNETVPLTVVITPEQQDSDTVEQKLKGILKPTTSPQFVTVSGVKGDTPSPFVMNRGYWEIMFQSNGIALIDYFVLIPAEYYQATVLTEEVEKPCLIGQTDQCKRYIYPSLMTYSTAKHSDAINPTRFISNKQQLDEMLAGPQTIPIIDIEQDELEYELTIETIGLNYVLLIEYVTPINETMPGLSGLLIVKFNPGDNQIIATMNLDDCPYSLCRQVPVNELTQEQQFYVTERVNKIVLKGDAGTLVGIKSIVAIPASNWHLDYIRPKPLCLKVNGKCTPFKFPKIDSKKIEFEMNADSGVISHPETHDNSTEVAYLKPYEGQVRIEGKVNKPGVYVFVIHYSQPDHPQSTLAVKVTTDDQSQPIEASLAISHCPSISGCRSVIKINEAGPQFNVVENFTIIIEETLVKGVWLDYLLIIEERDYNDKVLQDKSTLDLTKEFLKQCGQNHYYVDTSETGFCRNSIFSITSSYNSGAIPCTCSHVGSTSFECERFGGQCPCKSNVIGRTCTTCKSGYYGFPDCKPCGCPSGCSDDGVCICPNNVEGEKCDRCKPYTYGFDQIVGCYDCNCNQLGVVDNQLQCDLELGSCQCKENVVGRMCDRCIEGNYDFPNCNQCSCNRDGTTLEVCDQITAQCLCKENVEGNNCDYCAIGYYNLQSDNPSGCTKCFCFRKTNVCTSADLIWTQITGMHKWTLHNVHTNKTHVNVVSQPAPPQSLNDSGIGVELSYSSDDSSDKFVYFGAPSQFLGPKLNTYGGRLSYTIFYTVNQFSEPINTGDVILEGPVGHLIHYSTEQPPSTTYWKHSLEMVENEFISADGTRVSKDLLLMTLQNLTGLYIRASYSRNGVTTRLQDVTLDVGVELGDEIQYEGWNLQATLASSIEECSCPTGYKGLSCEQCAEGFYRINNGLNSYCASCECHGHTNECDVQTGRCLNCQHYTMGEHCEMCIPGYHGDATYGSPNDCMICACPLPNTSNNFATSCQVSNDGQLISCQCQEGYAGARCNYCASGFYGNPEIEGDYCKPCNCSGNIDTNDPNSCDNTNGTCLKCINNSSGTACNLCAPKYFGDAVLLKNCVACDCDDFGTLECDSFNGICKCLPGVTGPRCDQCLPDHWGIKFKNGCMQCDCAIASNSTQCDIETGQCSCATGVTGKQCDRCASGYWNYTQNGCDHCNCNNGYSVGFVCNTETGQCKCLPGAIGEKCEKCPHRWVLIPNERCQECTSCTDALLDSIEELQTALAPVAFDFQNKASSYFTTQRLKYIGEKVAQLKPQVNELDPSRVDLSGVTKEIELLENDAKAVDRKAEYGAKDAVAASESANNLTGNANSVLDEIRSATKFARKAVQNIRDIGTSLEMGEQPKVDSAIAEANQILADLKEKDLSSKLEQAKAQLNNAQSLDERMHIFTKPVHEQAEVFDDLLQEVKNFENKLIDLLNFTKQAEETAKKTEHIISKNRASKFPDKVKNVDNLKTEALDNIVTAANLVNNATIANEIAKNVLKRAKLQTEEGDKINDEIILLLDQLVDRTQDLSDLHKKAIVHADNTISRSDNLDHLLQSLKDNSNTLDAYQAASSYDSILKNVEEAERNINEALETTEKIKNLRDSLNERAAPSYTKSSILNSDAKNSLDEVLNQLTPNLNAAKRKVDEFNKINSQANNTLAEIIHTLNSMPPFVNLEDNTANKCDEATQKLNQVIESMEQYKNDIPAALVKAQSLPKDADDVLKTISQLQSQMSKIDIPIANLYNSVLEKSKDSERRQEEGNKNIEELKQLIKKAKEVANRIEVGVEFEDTSTLQVEIPDFVDELTTSTQVSAYFKTKKDNGFLLYLGNEEGTKLRRTTTDDYMAIEIENGYPVLIIDIGDGPSRIPNDKYVADDKWYQVIVDRIGRNVKFTIKEELENNQEKPHTKEYVLNGKSTIFNLDKDKSKLYVGGFTAPVPIQHEITFTSFEGQVEDLKIGDKPVGLWNFVDANNLKGALKRASTTKGYRFNGNGYITMNASKYASSRTTDDILLYFKTFEPEGLLFFEGQGSSFLAIQMEDGRVVLQFRLGEGDVLTLKTPLKYNDGKAHKLIAKRDRKTGYLEVDDFKSEQAQAYGNEYTLPPINHLHIGGLPSSSTARFLEVTNKGFDGCIYSLTVNGDTVELDKNVEAFGVTPGCQYSKTITLDGQQSFVKINNISIDQFQMMLKFKTSSPEALLFYVTNRDQTSTVSLSIVGGRLVFKVNGETLHTGSNVYNDDQWHVVMATHSGNLELVVDDYDNFAATGTSQPVHIISGDIFFGGPPPDYTLLSTTVETRKPFVGCLSDAVLNGHIIDFTDAVDSIGVTYGRCKPVEAIDIENRFGGGEEGVPPVALTTPPRTTTREPFRNNEITIPPTMPPTPKTKPTTKKPPPRVEKGCALGHNPDFYSNFDKKSYRFGTRNNSVIEFSRLPGRHREGLDLSVQFKTKDLNGGLIFYAADPSHSIFVALFLSEGKVHYYYNCGTETVQIISPLYYNDDGWHSITAVREQGHGKLTIDESNTYEGKATCLSSAATLKQPFYYGGLSTNNDRIINNLNGFYSPFVGCLRELKQNGRLVTEISHKLNVLPCHESDYEDGVFFGPNGGYVKLFDSHKVGHSMQISLEIKPRNMSGLLVGVFGKTDYLLLELIENEVILTVENGKGQFAAHYKLNDKFTLCDGSWHKILAIKSRHLATVAVDSHFSESGVGKSSSTDTKSGLFIGGGPPIRNKHSVSKQPFYGCIRNIKIDDKPIKVLPSNAYNNVNVGVCPSI